MFDANDDLLSGKTNSQIPNQGSEAQLIAELEKQSIEQIRQVRAHERFRSRVGVELRHGNASSRNDLHLTGKTSDISEGGCSAIFSGAVLPGDIFQLEFDPKAIDLPVVFGRALRCRMLKEGSYEVGFRFFSPIVLRPAVEASDDLFD